MLKICLLVLMISLTAFMFSTTALILHKITTAEKLEIKVNGKFDGTYLQDEIVNAVINTNIIENEHP